MSTQDELGQVLGSLEGDELSAALCVASGYSLALRLARSHGLTRRLTEILQADPEAGPRVVTWLAELSEREVDAGFESPLDTGMFVALVGLEAANSPFLRLAAQLVGRAPQTWWAEHGARAVFVTGSLASNQESSTDSWPTLEIEGTALHVQKIASTRDVLSLMRVDGQAAALQARVGISDTTDRLLGKVIATAATFALAVPMVRELAVNASDSGEPEVIKLQELA